MPSQYDQSYHEKFRKPVYDDPSDQFKRQLQREADEVLEMKAPSVPTQADEVEYIDWLQEDFKSDPWLTHRFRKYTANPKRIPWKNTLTVKRQYQADLMLNWILGTALFWPVGVFVGRRYRSTHGGVPLVPQQKIVYDFPNVSLAWFNSKQFTKYSIGTAMLCGLAFARYMTDWQATAANEWYNRPDFKPYPAMVKTPGRGGSVAGQGEDKSATLIQDKYYWKGDHKNRDYKKSAFYRFFFPMDADFTVEENPYRQMSPLDVRMNRQGKYVSHSTSNYSDHYQNPGY